MTRAEKRLLWSLVVVLFIAIGSIASNLREQEKRLSSFENELTVLKHDLYFTCDVHKYTEMKIDTLIILVGKKINKRYSDIQDSVYMKLYGKKRPKDF